MLPQFIGETFVVICRDDYPEGNYILATRQVFTSMEEALKYTAAIAKGREPLIIPGRWHQLRIHLHLTPL